MTTKQFQHIILPLKNKLFRFALSFLGNEADAMDVVQEVMMKAWEKIDEPSNFGNPEAWCMTLTKNRCLDLLKKKGRNHLPLADQYDLQAGSASPLEETESRESIDKIQEIISHLPDLQRTVIQLRDVEGYSYKEIADIMGVGMSHVKVLLHRARKQVQKRFRRVNQHGISYS